MNKHTRVGLVIALTILGVVGFIAPGGAVDKVGHVTEFSAGLTPVVLAGNEYGADPRSITAGPDGNLWFTESLANRIGRITPDGAITEFSAGLTDKVTSPGSEYPASPSDITAGPDGNLWFTEQSGPRVGRITPDGAITEFSAGITAVSYLTAIPITAGPDGNLWFNQGAPRETGGGLVARITPAGVATVLSPRPGVFLGWITAGPDGNVWFTEIDGQDNGVIVRITPAGKTTEFSSSTTGATPGEITAGCDGNLWFTANFIDFNTGVTDGRIGRITPKGKVTEFSAGITGTPGSITAGPDGNLWFTVSGDTAGGIGRITPKGKVTEFSAGITGIPNSITAGPDGNIWFTESDAQQNGIIGRIVPGPAKKARVRRDVTLPTTCPSARG